MVFDTGFVDASYFGHLTQVLWMIMLLWSSDGFCGCIILWLPVTGFVDGSYRDRLTGFVDASYCDRLSHVLWMNHTVMIV